MTAAVQEHARSPPDESTTKIFASILADGSEDLGLPFLRGLKDPVPCGSDSDPPQPGADRRGPVSAGHLRRLQTDRSRTVRRGVSHFHAGRSVNTVKPHRRDSCSDLIILLILFYSFLQKIFTEPGSLSKATLTKLRATCRARIAAETA